MAQAKNIPIEEALEREKALHSVNVTGEEHGDNIIWNGRERRINQDAASVIQNKAKN